MTAWNSKLFASPSDPAHKSDLSDILGDYGCGRKFEFKRREAANDRAERRWNEKAAVGNVTHAVSECAFASDKACAAILAGHPLTAIERVVDEECIAERGRYPEETVSEKERHATVAMLKGLFVTMPKYAARILAVEAPFAARVGRYYIAGNIDQVFETHSGGIGITDLKTKAQKPSLIVLDHGFESGFYSHAIEHGWFLRNHAITTERLPDGTYKCTGPTATVIRSARADARRIAGNVETERLCKLMEAGAPMPEYAYTFGRFPEEIWTVHLRDFVPYEKKGTKEVKRIEDCEHYGVGAGTKINYEKGDLRGGGWMRTRRQSNDGTRLEHLLSKVVRMVRMGIFVDEVTDNCERCPFKGPCLTDGYALAGDEAKQLQQSLRGLGDYDDGLGDLDDKAA